MSLRVPDHVSFEVLDGEAVLLNVDTARYHRLNRTATCAWEVLVAGGTVGQAAETVATRFDVDCEEAKADVSRLIGELFAAGLLEDTE